MHPNVVVITGGIASGKSTVSSMFEALGAPVFNADTLYHQLIAPRADGTPSDLAQKIAQAFPGVLLKDGTIDRAHLGQIVFQDTAKRAVLEEITHPVIVVHALSQFEACIQSGHSICFYDVPLFFEKNMFMSTGYPSIVVWVPRAVQENRLKLRNALLSQEEIT